MVIFTMTQIEKIEYSRVRLEKALDFLKAAKKTFEIGEYSTSANRSYYSVYYAIRAVLAFEYTEQSKHSGNISEFRKHYIRTGVFDIVFSDYIQDLFDTRTQSDYDPVYSTTKDDAEEQLQNACRIVKAITDYLNIRYEPVKGIRQWPEH